MIKYLRDWLFVLFKRFEGNALELNYLFWECTHRCNLNCLHCGSDCMGHSNNPDMPLSHFLSVLDTIPYKPKNFIVVLTGGEPLLRKDLEECGRAIKQRGIPWGLVSNGFAYTPERHIELLNAGMGSLTLSLDGMEQSHGWLRNSPLSFKRLDKAIGLAVSANRLFFDVVTCVNTRNINELGELYNYLKGKGVKSWRLFTIAPIGRAIGNAEMQLNSLQMLSLMNFISTTRKTKGMDIKFSCEAYVGKYEWKVRHGGFFCRAGINIGSVLIDGSISACPNISRNFIQGNIYKDSLWDVWQNRYTEFRNRRWNRIGVCKDCSHYKFCDGGAMHLRTNMQSEIIMCHNSLLSQAMIK